MRVKKFKSQLSDRPMQLLALLLTIPAFYLTLTGASEIVRSAGHAIYVIVATLMAAVRFCEAKQHSVAAANAHSNLDILILLGAIVSACPTSLPWSSTEWVLRMAYCGIVFVRLVTLLAKFVAPNRLLQICILAVCMLAVAGAGFFWLEPRVQSYGDGVWLAFTTGATVGYGDLVPSTPASRVFAGFIVLLGYALFSVVTASIAALLVGEDEKRLGRETHADLRALRAEIAALRSELLGARVVPGERGVVTLANNK